MNARLLVPVLIGAAVQCATVVAAPEQGGNMNECGKVVGAPADLRAELADFPDGGVLCLRPGRYSGGLFLERSVTLRGLADGVILDNDGRGTVLVIPHRIRVVIERMTLTGGHAGSSFGGAGILVDGFAEVMLRDCVIQKNRAGVGGGVFVASGLLTIQRCRLLGNQAARGSAIMAVDVARVMVLDSLIVGGVEDGHDLVRVGDGAQVSIEGSTLVLGGAAGTVLAVAGTTTSVPEVRIRDSILSGPEALSSTSDPAAKVHLERSVVFGRLSGSFELDATVRRMDPLFEAVGPEPFRPSARSPAVGLARGGRPDLLGRARPESGATAGAIER